MEYTGSYILPSVVYWFQQIYLYHQLIFLYKSFHGSIEVRGSWDEDHPGSDINRSMEVLKGGEEVGYILTETCVNRSYMEVLKL